MANSIDVYAFTASDDFYPYDVPGVSVAMFDKNANALYNSVASLNASNNEYRANNTAYSNVWHITVNNSGDNMYFTFPYDSSLYDYYLLGTVIGKTTLDNGFTYKPTNVYATGRNVDTGKYVNYPYYNLDIYNIDNAIYKGFGFSERIAFDEVGNIGIHNIQLADDKDSIGSVPANIVFEFGILAVEKGQSEEQTMSAILDKLDTMESSLISSIESSADKVVQGIEDQYHVNENENFGVGGIVEDTENKLGALTFASDTMIGMLDLFDSENAGDAVLTFPSFGIKVQGKVYRIWDDIQFDFSILEDNFGVLIEAVRWGTVMCVYMALCMYIGKAYGQIIGG